MFKIDIFISIIWYITLRMDIVLREQMCTVPWVRDPIQNHLMHVYETSSFPDITITVSTSDSAGQILATHFLHKIMLTRARFFDGMFSGNWKESPKNIINLPIACDPRGAPIYGQFRVEIISAFFKMLYTLDVDGYVSSIENGYLELYELCVYMGFKEGAIFLFGLISQNIGKETYAGILMWTHCDPESPALRPFYKLAMRWLKSFVSFLDQDDVMNLPIELLEEILSKKYTLATLKMKFAFAEKLYMEEPSVSILKMKNKLSIELERMSHRSIRTCLYTWKRGCNIPKQGVPLRDFQLGTMNFSIYTHAISPNKMNLYVHNQQPVTTNRITLNITVIAGTQRGTSIYKSDVTFSTGKSIQALGVSLDISEMENNVAFKLNSLKREQPDDFYCLPIMFDVRLIDPFMKYNHT